MSHITLVLFAVLLSSQSALAGQVTLTGYDVKLSFPTNPFASPVLGSVDVTFKTDANGSDDNEIELILYWGSTIKSSTTNEAIPNEADFLFNSSPIIDVSWTLTAPNVSTEQMNVTVRPKTAGDTFKRNSVYSITISFKNQLNASSVKGMFLQNTINDDSSLGFLISTNLRPNYAHKVFPCNYAFTSPTMKLTLIRPTAWTFTSASLDSLQTSSNSTDGTTTDIFSETSSNGINLNAFGFTLGNNMILSNPTMKGNTTLNFYSTKKSNAQMFQDTVDFLANYYDMTEEIVGFSHPLKTLSIVLVPSLPMPFASFGIIYIRDDMYWVLATSQGSQSEGQFKSLLVPVLHEYFRQFTEFSTRPSTWGDEWLSQAMANFLKYTLLNNIYLPYDFKTDINVVARQMALALDTNSSPIQTDVSDTTSIQYILMDPLRQLKGLFLLTMADLSLPAGSVESAIKSFLSKNKQSMASASAFFTELKFTISALPSSISPNILDKFVSWTTFRGYPQLTLSTFTKTTVDLTLTLPSNTVGGAPADYYVPVTLSSQSEPRLYKLRQDIWLNGTSTKPALLNVDVSSDWVIANPLSNGYYRTNYSAEDWKHIIDAMASKDSKLIGYTQLIDDAFAFAVTDTPLSFIIPLTMSISLLKNNEKLFMNWFPVYKGLSKFDDYLWEQSDAYASFKNFMTPFLEKLNSLIESGNLDSFEHDRVSSLFYNTFCTFNVGNYRNLAVESMYQLLSGNQPNTIPSSSYDSAVCCGAENRGLSAKTLSDTIINATSSHYMRHYSAVALGCLSDYKTNILIYTSMVDYPDNLIPYFRTVMWYLAEKQPVNLLHSLISDDGKFAHNLQERLGVPTMATIISRMASKLSSQDDSNNLTALSKFSLDTLVKTSASDGAQVVSARKMWLNNNIKALKTSLATTTQTSTSSTSTATISMFLFLPLSLLVFSSSS